MPGEQIKTLRLRYFVVDSDNQLHIVPASSIEQSWAAGRTDNLYIETGEEFRLISVLCTDNLVPIVTFFLRLNVDEHGQIDSQSRRDVFSALSDHRGRRYSNPAAQRQFHNWPRDWRTQLAVALDVPAANFRNVGIGGPLVMSELWGIPLSKVMAYFHDAAQDRNATQDKGFGD